MKRVFAFIGFSCAITLFLLNIIPFKYSYFVMIFAGIVFGLSLLFKSIRQAYVVAICFASALFACLIFIFVNVNTVLPVQSLDKSTVTAEFEIVDIPTKTSSGCYSYVVKTRSVNLPDSPQNFKMKIYSTHSIDADYYDNITADITIYKTADNAMSSYGRFGDNIYVRAFVKSYEVEVNDKKPVNYYIIMLRQKIIHTLNNSFNGDKGALLSAILTGDKSNLSEKVISDFKLCGASHLCAVSGFHISLLTMGIYFLLKRTNVSQLMRTVISLFVICLYIGVADFSKSAIRAGIMMSTIMLAKLIDKKADLINSLGFAVFLLCLNPFVVSDVSAVLSVSAVLGIAVIKPAFDKYLRPENKILRYVYDGVTVTASVIISTLPAVWIFFGSVSIMGVVVNIFMVLLAQVALVSSLLFVIFNKIFFVNFLLSKICSASSFLMLKIADFCADNFAFLSFDISDNIFGIAISLSFLFLGISLLISKKINLKITSYFLIVIFFVTMALNICNYHTTAYINLLSDGCVIVYDRHCVMAIDAKSRDSYEVESISKRYGISPLYVISEDLMTSFEFDVDLCECINVKCIGKDIYISVYDKTVKMTDDIIQTGDFTAVRNVLYKYSDDVDYVIEFKDNAVTRVWRDD